ncbi:sulfite exporter TauE/SafE family protein [Luethyella okanaganae]|uniref:Probable membrane transporter protein n=1 Tax=Luethyella okanaganae TaxID=69372 RepID=A0ABW1VH50_9MICO
MPVWGNRRVSVWLWLVLVGLVAGYLSGLFGVGGGVIIVPALVLLLGFDVRVASGTSLAAIAPSALVGVIAYVLSDSVDWILAALLVIGSVVGAQLGSHLLNRIPREQLAWSFIGFLALVIASLFLVIPSRDATIELNAIVVAGTIVLGLATGILSGLLGVGGGIVVVPVLIVLFGTSDLVAKGTSLAMIVPTAISGTVGNIRRRNLDLPAAVAVGLAACTTTGLGALSAAAVPPQLGNTLFAGFLALVAARMIGERLRKKR